MDIPYGYPGSSYEKFQYDETMLEASKYHEWFWAGLTPAQAAYLRQPARVDKAEQEPVAYDGWESEQPRMWQHEAECADADPKIFFDESNNPKREYLKPDAEWRQFCPQCPVQETCLASARDSESVGVWGGVYRFHPRNSSDLHKIEELDDRI
jgi:Transcription factor WhiB